MRNYLCTDAPLHFLFPIDGDCLNSRDGTPVPGGLCLEAVVAAPTGIPADTPVSINGVPARFADGVWRAPVVLSGRETELFAEAGDLHAAIRVFRLPGAEGGYRLSSDDNILFLADLTQHTEYNSLFDNPYLAMYREAHEKYGAKVHLNLFTHYRGEAKSRFTAHPNDFDLSMMTDRFRHEWQANADWLKLAFHARDELPDRIYKQAGADEITADFEATRREILRFAGEESFTDTCTVHWGEATPAGVRALRACGIRALTGYFEHNRRGEPLVAYFYPDDLIDHVGARDFWYDRDLDMFYGRIDLVLNLRTRERNAGLLDEILATPTRSGFVSLMIHEQHFYPDYCNYLPDYTARVLDACATVSAAGLRGRHITEIV